MLKRFIPLVLIAAPAFAWDTSPLYSGSSFETSNSPSAYFPSLSGESTAVGFETRTESPSVYIPTGYDYTSLAEASLTSIRSGRNTYTSGFIGDVMVDLNSTRFNSMTLTDGTVGGRVVSCTTALGATDCY